MSVALDGTATARAHLRFGLRRPLVRAAKRGTGPAPGRERQAGFSSCSELVDFALPSHAALRCVLWETSEEQGHPRPRPPILWWRAFSTIAARHEVRHRLRQRRPLRFPRAPRAPRAHGGGGRHRVDLDGRARCHPGGIPVEVSLRSVGQDSRARERAHPRPDPAPRLRRGGDQEAAPRHGHPDPPAAPSDLRREGGGDARRALRRARDPRHRDRVVEGGVRRPRHPVRGARRAHARSGTRHPLALEGDAGAVRGEVLPLGAARVEPEAGAEAGRADRRRRPRGVGGAPGGALRRRLLPGCRRAREAPRALRRAARGVPPHRPQAGGDRAQRGPGPSRPGRRAPPPGPGRVAHHDGAARVRQRGRHARPARLRRARDRQALDGSAAHARRPLHGPPRPSLRPALRRGGRPPHPLRGRRTAQRPARAPAARRPVVVGFGRSDKPVRREDYTYQRHVEWMRGVLEQLELRNVTLVGQDWGGLIGLRLAAEHPERFARIVAANTFLPTGDRPAGPAFLAWRKYSQETPDFQVGGIVKGGCVTDLAPEIVAAYDAPFPDDRYKAGARQFPLLVPVTPEDPAAAANRKAWEVLRRWTKPFLTAFSDSDPITGGADRILQQAVPGAEGQPHTTIAGAGHFLQEDKGEALARVVVDFIARTSTA